MHMHNILFVTTQYRVGERVYPIIPNLSKKYNLDLIKLYQMDPTWKWPGDKDLRINFDNTYLKYFDNVYNNINVDYDKYDLIITDDNRHYNGLSDIYRQRKCLVLACSHGVSDHEYEIHNVGRSYDGCFVFGQKEARYSHQIPAGIPANDQLKEYQNVKKDHILVIVNYLGNVGKISTGNGDYFALFDKDLFDSLNLVELQQKYKSLVAIKLKSRPDANLKQDIDYLKTILPKELIFKVFLDVEDDNLLIAQSHEVISAPSTFALKPIQLEIPTKLIYGTGQLGIFYDYESNKNFIEDTLEGGKEFNSTQCFLDYIERCINER